MPMSMPMPVSMHVPPRISSEPDASGQFGRNYSEMSLYGSSGSLATMAAQRGSPAHGSEVGSPTMSPAQSHQQMSPMQLPPLPGIMSIGVTPQSPTDMMPGN